MTAWRSRSLPPARWRTRSPRGVSGWISRWRRDLDFGFWILDFGLERRLVTPRQSKIQNPKSGDDHAFRYGAQRGDGRAGGAHGYEPADAGGGPGDGVSA